VGLTKAEVNERFYDTVAGEIAFETEAQGFLHPLAVAKLIAAQARDRGRREVKVLELGANNSAFAVSVLKLLTSLTAHGEVELERIDYFAVELARRSLEVFLAEQQGLGDFQNVTAGAPGSPLVGSLTRLGVPKLTLHLVHADAAAFVGGGSGRFDVIVLNELLDDLPGHVYHAREDGDTRELVAHAHEEGEQWRVEISEEPAPGVELPPGMLSATSPAGVAVVRGAASLLESGGVLLVHDYGFTEPHIPAAHYAKARRLPDFVELELPPDADEQFPRAFFRIFGNDDAKVVQITTDVGFAELIEELRAGGTVITVPHGNALLASRDSREDLRKGDGVFLSEFGLLGPGDDLAELVARLDREQADTRLRFADEFLEGNPSVFSDLLYLKR
jgi:putative S-adenosyl-L-methionine-dependent methyltransferase